MALRGSILQQHMQMSRTINRKKLFVWALQNTDVIRQNTASQIDSYSENAGAVLRESAISRNNDVDYLCSQIHNGEAWTNKTAGRFAGKKKKNGHYRCRRGYCFSGRGSKH